MQPERDKTSLMGALQLLPPTCNDVFVFLVIWSALVPVNVLLEIISLHCVQIFPLHSVYTVQKQLLD
jgi:hypothetical protein